MNSHQESLRRASEAVNSVRIFPDVAMRIREVANDPRAGVRDLARVVRVDPILSLRIMKMASSATYGAGRAPTDIDGAVRRLGFRALRDIALAMSLGSMADGSEEGRALWEHSLAVASACRLLVPVADSRRRESMFLAGLMHDLGRIIILQRDPKWFRATAECLDDAELCEQERSHFGWDHAILGGQCLRSFGISSEVADAVHGHHTKRHLSSAYPGDRAVLTIMLAHELCGGQADQQVVESDASVALGLDRSMLEAVYAGLPAEIKRVRADFGCSSRPLPPGPGGARSPRRGSRVPRGLRPRR